MQNELQEHRANLTTFLIGRNMFVIYTSLLSIDKDDDFRSSAIRSEAALESISNSVSHSQQIPSSLDQRLLDIQQAVTRTHNAVLSQPKIVNELLRSISLNPDYHITSLEQPTPLPFSSGQGHETAAVEIDSDSKKWQFLLPGDTSRRSEVPRERCECNFSTYQKRRSPTDTDDPKASILGPTSPFKVSFPETYSVDQRLPINSFIVIDSCEHLSSIEYRTILCQIYLQNTPRKWYRWTLSLQIRRSSVYWVATRVSRQHVQIKQTTTSSRSLQLPHSLQMRIQATLSRAESAGEDLHLKYRILNRDPVQAQHDETSYNLHTDKKTFTSNCQNHMAFLNDLGCDQYLEDEVIQVQMLDPPSRFASCINGTMVYEMRLSDSEPTAELLYNIELLHRMKGAPGFARLVGIVTDNSRKRLQGYMIELPRARQRIARIALDPSVSWSRRQKWARQLIESIAYLHFQGLVAGVICAYRMPVILDNSDDVHFWYFRNIFAVGREQGGYYPPEYQHLRTASPTMTEAQCPKLTTKTDIFHLGLILWALASQRSPLQGLVCTKSDCPKGSLCKDESHSRPIALHPLPEVIPQYYKDVMNSCITDNPEDRPTARELLAKFPAKGELHADRCGILNVELPSGDNGLSAQVGGILQATTCSRCNTDHIQEMNYFHCNACEFGDFDLCQQCYGNGQHCFDNDHFLIELDMANGRTVSGRYCSSPDCSGSRKIVKC